MSHNDEKGVNVNSNEGQTVDMMIGGEFPFPCPMEDGVRMDLFGDNLAVMIQGPEMDKADVECFRAGFTNYSYLESSTKIPVALWTFNFNNPMSHVECNFDAKTPHIDSVRRFVDEKLGQKNGIHFFLLQGKTIVSVRVAYICDEAWEAFYKTIETQLKSNYSDDDYFASLESMYNFTIHEIVSMGKSYSMK